MPYSESFKKKMISKMTGPNARSATSLSKEVGIAQATLSRWLRQARFGAMTDDERADRGRRSKDRKRWTPAEKIRVVMEAASKSESELGALLRREGLHEAELSRFREEVLEAAAQGMESKRRRRGPTPEQKKMRKLEKELKRKDKALAEAAALLVLRKKAEAFFLPEEEGDDTDETNE